MNKDERKLRIADAIVVTEEKHNNLKGWYEKLKFSVVENSFTKDTCDKLIEAAKIEELRDELLDFHQEVCDYLDEVKNKGTLEERYGILDECAELLEFDNDDTIEDVIATLEEVTRLLKVLHKQP